MKILKIVILSFLLVSTGMMAGCGTVRGVGEDVSSTGRVITGSAS